MQSQTRDDTGSCTYCLTYRIYLVTSRNLVCHSVCCELDPVCMQRPTLADVRYD